MKNMLLTFLLFFTTSFFLFSQQYHPFLNTTSWYQITSMLGQAYNWIYVSHDTIIGNETYKVILVDGGVTSSWYVREDVAQKKVYTPAGVLYDFNLQAGSQFNFGSITFNVLSVDSVLTNVGYRKRFQLQYNNTTVQIIEGVGSIEHPFRISNFGIDPVYRLACSYEGQQNVYNRQGENCPANIYTSTIDADFNTSHTIFPNPISDYGRIIPPKNWGPTKKVIFTDAQGKETLINHEILEDFILIHSKGSSKGIYFVTLQNEVGFIMSKKFIFY